MILVVNSLLFYWFEIEVIEIVFVGWNDIVLKVLCCLKNLGVKVVFDDFGFGYLSLSYLCCFFFDMLKIDCDFVFDMNGNVEVEVIFVFII